MSDHVEASVRSRCAGVVALPARLEPWMRDLCATPQRVEAWLNEHGSPVNLLDPSMMARNVDELRRPADRLGVELGIYFARKANKALSFVDEASRLGLGIDLASEQELAQVLRRNVSADALVMTAAVKPSSLVDLCLASGTTIVLDNADEVRLTNTLAGHRYAPVALRLAPDLGDDRLQTRFGFGVDEAIAAFCDRRPKGLRVDGVHFHLDGYDPADRVMALGQALDLLDALREHGHDLRFIDIGGGIPVDYLGSADAWDLFWIEHRRGLLGDREPLTFDGHGLGLISHRGELVGRPNVYPYHQPLTRETWLTEVLTGTVAGRSGTVAEEIRARGIQLRCEPGRALLDGCGITAANVVYRKQRRDGTWLIGTEMNRTQCRSTSDDFMVDPLVIRPESEQPAVGASSDPIEGYLVGAYCIERELLTWRRMRFPEGVSVGDIVVFPNTAGYHMHILESSSHQIPLARNLVVGANGSARLDPIDAVMAGDR